MSLSTMAVPALRLSGLAGLKRQASCEAIDKSPRNCEVDTNQNWRSWPSRKRQQMASVGAREFNARLASPALPMSAPRPGSAPLPAATAPCSTLSRASPLRSPSDHYFVPMDLSFDVSEILSEGGLAEPVERYGAVPLAARWLEASEARSKALERKYNKVIGMQRAGAMAC